MEIGDSKEEMEEELLGFCGNEEKKKTPVEAAESKSSVTNNTTPQIVKITKSYPRSSPKDVIMRSNVVTGKRISKPKGPKGASPPPEGWTATKALQNINRLPLTRSPKKDSIKSLKRFVQFKSS